MIIISIFIYFENRAHIGLYINQNQPLAGARNYVCQCISIDKHKLL